MNRKLEYAMDAAWREIHGCFDQDLIPAISYVAQAMFDAGVAAERESAKSEHEASMKNWHSAKGAVRTTPDKRNYCPECQRLYADGEFRAVEGKTDGKDE